LQAVFLHSCKVMLNVQTAASIWLAVRGGRGSGLKQIRFFQANFPKKLNFSGIFTKNFDSYRQISGEYRFFSGNLNFFDFPGKNVPFIATSGQIILFLFKSHQFRTYFLYMIRYNNISRPIHVSPCASTITPCPKSGGRDPQPQD